MMDVYERLTVLQVHEPPVNVSEAYARFIEQTAARPARSSKFPIYGHWRWAAAAVIIIAVSVSPVRSLGQRFLSMLRVQKLAVIPVGDSFLNESTNTPGKVLTQLISDNFLMTLKPGAPVNVTDLSAARAYVGFPVEELSGLGPLSRVAVEDQAAFQVTLSVDKMRAVVEEAGRSDIQIPASVNGSTVAVHVSKGVRAEYDNCDAGDTGCVHFLQVPVPDVGVPQGLDMTGLAEAGLQLTGLSAAEAHYLAATVDWASTLVIPIPQSQATYERVPVDGVSGLLIQWKPKRQGAAGLYELLWVKNGVIRALQGRGNSARALAAAAQPML